MDDFSGMLARDYGFKPQGKSAPMAPPRNSSSSNYNNFSSTPNFGLGSSPPDNGRPSSSSKSKSSSNPIFDDNGGDGLLFNDVFGGSSKYRSSDSRGPPEPSTLSDFDYDSIFKDQTSGAKSASMPVFDKPVYDDDIFEGLPSVKTSASTSTSTSGKYEKVLSSISSSPKLRKEESSLFDDLLGNFGRKEAESKRVERPKDRKDTTAFDDLIPGFGARSSPNKNRSTSDSGRSQKPCFDSTKTSNMIEDPFVVLGSSSSPSVSSSGLFTDSLNKGVFDDLDSLDSLGKSGPRINRRDQDRSDLRRGSMNGVQSPVENSEHQSQKKVPVDDFQDSYQTSFDMPSTSVGQTSAPSYMHPISPNDTYAQVNSTSKSDEDFEASNDVWLTVSEIPLFTKPTSAPPPSRPPPPRPTGSLKSEAGSFTTTNQPNKVNVFSSFPNFSRNAYSPKSACATARSPVAYQIDELEDFAMGRSANDGNEHAQTGEDIETTSVAAAAAMKEAMDKAEAKFRHAKVMREKEYMKNARSREGVQMGKDDYQELKENQERLDRERQRKDKEEDKEQRRLEKEREVAREFEREQEEKEREQRKGRERLKELERERELARQAVERATREARERAVIDARAKAERVAAEKAAAEARERAEKAAVQRAHAEARERAATGAKERAERAASEARERSNAEARARAERAAVEKAAAEARERSAAESRERAATAARANQQKNENDLESFFGMNSRPTSAARARTNVSDPVFDSQSKGGHQAARTTSNGASSSMKKASSTKNIVDDLTSIFGGGAASSSGEFQEVEGETEDRRRARLERHQRTQERAAKALAEKNERDLNVQREQAERHRIGESLDVEIKRWAAGKEGNLRALLSTMQYVLWPECGWQPVSLTDLITAASVKKIYRKATLCIHPDKVQQKGANLQQKYIAEKVFDLLKEAWNKFNSEELF